MTRRAWWLVPLLTLVLASCGSGDDSGGRGDDSGSAGPTTSTIAVPDEWDMQALAVAEGLAASVQDADLGGDDFAALDPSFYAKGAQRGGFAMPQAVGNCTLIPLEAGVEGEDVEVSVFADETARDEWSEARLGYLCEQGSKSAIELPGYPMVLGDRWAAQPDSEPVGRRLAPLLGGDFQYQRCLDRGGWDDASADRIEGVAADVAEAGAGCDDFFVQDKDFVAGQFADLGLPIPGAVGDCTIDGETFEMLASLTAEDLEATLLARKATDCATQRVSGNPLPTYVVGELWAGRASGRAIAAEVADATGGKVEVVDCAAVGG